MTHKIRQAQKQRIPYMLVVGKREIETDLAAVRLRSEEYLGAMALDSFIERVRRVIAEKNDL